jgi:hypothetical protein
MKYIVDIDGTICEHVNNPGFGTGKVYYDRIEKINQLFDEGHEIIYYTARGMGEYDGSIHNAHQKWYNYTYNQLETWGCKFTKLILGKYSGDIYIDDKGVNSDDFFRSN